VSVELSIIVGAATLPWLWSPFVALVTHLTQPAAYGQTSSPGSPITVTMVSPVNGSTVSNTIDLTSLVSTTGPYPITKVEFYRDGLLVATVTNKSIVAPPTNLKVQ